MNRRPLRHRNSRRGLTLVELMLALTITTMIAGALAGMMAAVSAGVTTRRDSRGIMVRAHAAVSRLSAYVVPARCALDLDDGRLVIWFNDSRESATVHASELRWLVFDADAGSLDVHFVSFPADWTITQKNLADREYGPNTNWMSVLRMFQARAQTAKISLVDGLDSFDASAIGAAVDSQVITIDLGFTAQDGTRVVRIEPAIRVHQPQGS